MLLHFKHWQTFYTYGRVTLTSKSHVAKHIAAPLLNLPPSTIPRANHSTAAGSQLSARNCKPLQQPLKKVTRAQASEQEL